VVLPKEMAKTIPKTHLLTEDEWRSIGVQQSKGWVHYMIHEPGEFKIKHLFMYFVVLCIHF
jgi:hypothetical protein